MYLFLYPINRFQFVFLYFVVIFIISLNRYCALLYCRNMSLSRRIKYILYSVEMPFKTVESELNKLQRTTLGILNTTLYFEHGSHVERVSRCNVNNRRRVHC
jgi:hypothetical protein